MLSHGGSAIPNFLSNIRIMTKMENLKKKHLSSMGIFFVLNCYIMKGIFQHDFSME